MNQVKYLIYACLLLCCFATAFYIFKVISSTKVVEQNTSVVSDYVEAPTEPATSMSPKGKVLFQQNCGMCHTIDKQDGNWLKRFTKRGPWTEKENVYQWVKNPEAFMKVNAYTQRMKAEYGVMMLASPNLTNEDIDAIVDYINNY